MSGEQLATFPATWLDVFAEAPLGGNLHVVVHDADALSLETMARFSARTRLSETSFVQAPSPTVDDATYRHRIFTVAGEIPFAGHPSLGTGAAVALKKGVVDAEFVQETGVGLQSLRVRWHGDPESSSRTASVDLAQNPAEFLGVCDPAAALEPFGLAPEDARPALSPEVVSTGLPTLIVVLRDVAALGRIELDINLLHRALGRLDCTGVVTCYLLAETPAGTWRARCFTPQVAGGEDAATGSAAGPFAAYAERHLGTGSVTIDQGVEMGSPSRLMARSSSGKVTVSGTVRLVGEGTIELPT